ncbi:MAG: dihydroorotate dehydrogenase electron transfer subunit [Lachnospiraceae bacterium]|jgi:dihydroorotate dehydrogenase electron transfer subunit|nr:dihydroorotate dehydrogenase electron transfer subunit [Lachnospiraceae bacterium]
MNPKIEQALVLTNQEISPGIFDLFLRTKIACEAIPGQFVCLYPQNQSALLPRPISICQCDPMSQTLRLVYRVVGTGTREFASYPPGEEIQIVGPLGNGFPMEELLPLTTFGEKRSLLLVGGGIGIAPLLAVAQNAANVRTVLGYRNHDLFLEAQFSTFGKTYVATEDGSVQTKGTVISVLEEASLTADILFACGPLPMLRAVKAYCEAHHILAYLSLEERMACGIGACLGCVTKTNKVHPHTQVKNARICTEGPVFMAQEVDLS